ncbi:MAG: DNA repair protein RadA [Bacteroidaceae bacterium]|nr:DNA repair protein RadA [Bacteroidaceae bacterium]
MAKKAKTAYVCSNCGHDEPKWVGRCPSCGEWNTMKEFSIAPEPHRASSSVALGGGISDSPKAPVRLSDISAVDVPRLRLHDEELTRVLGGGLVPGSLTLLGGEPGIGKSTLLLQTVLSITDRTVLYVSGEESERQIKLRADRLTQHTSSMLYLVCETEMQQIFAHIKNLRPSLLIIDSIQTVFSSALDAAPGSVSQIRECATLLLRFAKESGTPVILIGHITKDGTIAGPKVLEHIVDTVLQFEGDRHYFYRVLRVGKNRFGSTNEIGIYEMRGDGLHPVDNPSGLLRGTESEGLSGIAVAAAVEGVRPFLIETQALVSTAAYGTAQRSCTGFDNRRLNMLLAVLEKRVGFKLAQKDVFLNIAGGLRVGDPAIDLSVISAVLSSNVDTPIERGICLTGEVGLSGELRPVTRIIQRVAEAAKLGFSRMVIPASNMSGLENRPAGIDIIPASRVEEALRVLFG